MDPHVPNNKLYMLNEIGRGANSVHAFPRIIGRVSVKPGNPLLSVAILDNVFVCFLCVNRLRPIYRLGKPGSPRGMHNHLIIPRRLPRHTQNGCIDGWFAIASRRRRRVGMVGLRLHDFWKFEFTTYGPERSGPSLRGAVLNGKHSFSLVLTRFPE